MLLPDPWSRRCQLPSQKTFGTPVLVFCWCQEGIVWCACVYVEQILCGPHGQSKIRKLDKTQFVFLSSIFLQHYSPSTVPRLFPAEARAESLPGNGVLLLIHSNWNKMQLFIQTRNPRRLQACHSIQCFILTLADRVQGCLLGH